MGKAGWRLIIVLLGFWMFAETVRAQDTYVTIKTSHGNMRVLLYNETPEHRREFLKLVNSDHFDGTLFYRVIENFVIQGGSSDSRNAPPGKHIGYGSGAHNISSEFNDRYFHKRGAICAPRQPENINHFRMSDISQFYIVQGRVYTHEELDILEKRVNNPILKELREKYYVPKKPELDRLREEDPRAFNALIREIRAKIDFDFNVSDHMYFTDAQREAYTTIGGLPDLDGDYTVFGEVVEGLEVVSIIAALKTDKNDRPLTDVVIKIE
ncbi:peptidylprolyl isomerase [Geofilum rubicundum]|uniref:peptidylprolyl isomerase n=1 Tax=Geofilum rubicundum JCM 15548 TaxID=1236989 RepID=A0A0E9LVX2_9BACT|nr:peptidylprolyl isomerase [Geofilum rubicundum]GAO29010.1 peptidyl-prolyl cis-trans isomerase PpiC [Geofilum rubicundum JCM 15548]